METTIVKIDPAEFGLENDKAAEVEQVFAPVIAERDGLIGVYSTILSSEISESLTIQARELRLKLVKVRTATDKVHKVQKAFYLAGGRFVDAWKTRNNTVIEQMEEKLSEIENYYVNIEKQRIAALKIERIAKLSEVCDNPELYQVELMTDEAFNSLVEGQKLVKEARIAAEKKAEEDRLAAIEAERIEQERIRKENELLKAEAERKQKEFEAEQAKAEAERKAAEQAAAKERAEAAAKLKAEQDAADKLRAEIAAKAAAEAAAKAEAARIEAARIEAEKKAAKAPDKDKLKAFVLSIQLPVLPELKSEESKLKAADIVAKFESFRAWAVNQIENI